MGLGTNEFDTIEQVRDFFADDEFAYKCLGAHIDSYDFETREAVVSMDIDERHHNAQGFVMGGVHFALGDFALAVSSNVNQPPSASTSVSIQHMRRVKGSRLVAKAAPIKIGRSLSFFVIDVFDDLGTHVAHLSAEVMRTEH